RPRRQPALSSIPYGWVLRVGLQHFPCARANGPAGLRLPSHDTTGSQRRTADPRGGESSGAMVEVERGQGHALLPLPANAVAPAATGRGRDGWSALSPFMMTSRLAPMSASTAIQSVAAPVTARSTKAALTASEKPMFTR